MDAETGAPVPRSAVGGQFAKLWVASATSNLGDGVWLVAAPLLAASLTRDPTLVAGLAVAQRVPWLVFPLVSGALADRLDRRRAMVAVALLRAALVAALGLAVLTGRATMPLLYAVFFLIATGETLFDTAAAGLLPALVPREALPKANARLAGTWTAANQFVGPPLGGILFAVSAPLPFLIGSGGLAVAAALMATLRGSFKAARPEAVPPTHLRAEIAEGIGWLWRHRLLRTLALAMAVLNLCLVAQVAIMVLFAEQRLGLGPGGFGLLLTAYGVGGVVGGLVAERVLARVGDAAYLRLAIVVEGAVPATIALSGSPILVGLVLALFGLHATVWGALLSSLRQQLTPDPLRSRVASIHGLIEYGTAAPGALLGGLLAARFGLTAPFWLGAAAAVLLIPFVWATFSEETVRAARTGGASS